MLKVRDYSTPIIFTLLFIVAIQGLDTVEEKGIRVTRERVRREGIVANKSNEPVRLLIRKDPSNELVYRKNIRPDNELLLELKEGAYIFKFEGMDGGKLAERTMVVDDVKSVYSTGESVYWFIEYLSQWKTKVGN